MIGDLVLVVIGLGVAAFLGGGSLRDVRRGALSPNQFGAPVTRAESPRTFWFATSLSLVMAAIGLATSIAAIGKLAGWWEFGS